jgi:hypothetical protein
MAENRTANSSSFLYTYRILYDRSTQFWMLLLSVLKSLPRAGSKGRDMRLGLYWGAHQRFYKGLLIAAKVCLLSVWG